MSIVQRIWWKIEFEHVPMKYSVYTGGQWSVCLVTGNTAILSDLYCTILHSYGFPSA